MFKFIKTKESIIVCFDEKYMPMISSVGFLCFDEFEDNLNEKVFNIFTKCHMQLTKPDFGLFSYVATAA